MRPAIGTAPNQIGSQVRAIVPKSAVATRNKTSHVFVVGSDKVAEDRVVLVAPSGQGDTFAIQRGDLMKGENIVATVTEEVADGVVIEGGGAAAPAKPAAPPPAAPPPAAPPAKTAPTGSNK